MIARAPLHLATSLLAAAVALAARGDVFSPGDLARPHANLEGLANCTKCHVAGEQLSGERCLECHKELAGPVAAGRGFHGRIPHAERACEKCHHEHQGREFPLVDWGKGGRKAFDHARTGYDLRGKHRRADCARCHDRRLVQEPVVLDMLGKQPARATLLGAPQACAACHFDEHRAQLGGECQRCHDEDAWKPARRFAHARARYPLDGKHAKVACAKCHKPEEEAAARAAAPGQTPPIAPASFVRYKGMPFQACTDCHKDPHQGRLGASCTSCHTPVDWKRISAKGRERAFHEKTRYPLRGAHVAARCEACHGPFPGVKARFRGIPFERCTDCHADAHAGQLAGLAPATARGAKGARALPAAAEIAAGGAVRTCDACHGLDAWLPARFEADDHDRLSYRLEGAHRAVACALCHPKDPRLEERVPARVRQELRAQGRPLPVSLARLDIPKANDCRTCHRDPHAGQFDARLRTDGCGACHGVSAFRSPRFDHAKDSKYPLTGKHEKVACAACHRRDAAGVVRYRPLETACQVCHADPHAGQLGMKGKGTDCARCHETAGWKTPLRFVHAPPFTTYTLAGKHAKVACEKCHPAVKTAGAEVRRYRPVPRECQDCHVDFHKGAFRGFVR
jgi:hypothetical protein